MRVEYTGRHVEIAPELRDLTQRKLKKLDRVLRGITHVKVTLTSDKRRHLVEVGVASSRLTLTATEEGVDWARSLTTVLDKLTRQAQRHVGKARGRKYRGRQTALWDGVLEKKAPSEGGPRVVASRRFFAKPMTVDDAALEVKSSAEGFVVFRDSATARLNVLYRRKDGSLGLIEPES